MLIVEDHPVFREGLALLTTGIPGHVVCGEAGTARHAFDAISKLNPDLVLMDLNLPDKNGLELLRDIRSLRPELPVLVISMHEEEIYGEPVLRAGGRGYIMKYEDTDKVKDAITKVSNGQVYASERIAAKILDGLTRPRSTADNTVAAGRLTTRELEILRLTGQGKDSRTIADELQISLKTVDTHRWNLREKLGLSNGTELIHYAVRWVRDQI
ncbi:response regulator [Prosthecobacter sp.]|uniref:response regulator n=1 Tax=Prosthecobacter sp. TaxID=1965333 RepID=UPI003782D756